MTVSVGGLEDVAAVFTPQVADLLHQVLDHALEDDPDLHAEAVLDVATSIAVRRAELLGRAILPVDVEFVLSMICRWPFKPPPPSEYREYVDKHVRDALSNGDVYGVASEVLEVSLLLPIETLQAVVASGNGQILFRQ